MLRSINNTYEETSVTETKHHRAQNRTDRGSRGATFRRRTIHRQRPENPYQGLNATSSETGTLLYRNKLECRHHQAVHLVSHPGSHLLLPPGSHPLLRLRSHRAHSITSSNPIIEETFDSTYATVTFGAKPAEYARSKAVSLDQNPRPRGWISPTYTDREPCGVLGEESWVTKISDKMPRCHALHGSSIA